MAFGPGLTVETALFTKLSQPGAATRRRDRPGTRPVPPPAQPESALA